MEIAYLIRYGLMRQVGRFDSSDRFARGQTVVIRSHRGTELGEVLTEVPSSSGDPAVPLPNPARVLRAAGPDDFARARRADQERPARYALCRRLFEDGVWPLELIDVEPLLDDRRTVLHYLGPHRLDTSGLLAALRTSYDLDVVLEPVGRDAPETEEVARRYLKPVTGDCGGGSCGTGGGCGDNSSTATAGCSDCGVKNLLKSRHLSPAH